MPTLEEMLQNINDKVTQYGVRLSDDLKFTMNDLLIMASDQVLKKPEEDKKRG